MKYQWQRVVVMGALVLVLGAPALLAQKYEVNAYGGGIWPARTSVGDLKDGAIWGARGGVFVDSSFELEGAFGYINHFNIDGVNVKSRGHLWEFAGNYNFSKKDWPVFRGFTPFVVVGAGAIRTRLKDTDSYSFVTGRTVTSTPFGSFVTTDRVNVEDGNTFFAVSYGGGIKSVKILGPLGLRLDVRGRTLPNYYHTSPTWLEATAGFNVMWGER